MTEMSVLERIEAQKKDRINPAWRNRIKKEWAQLLPAMTIRKKGCKIARIVGPLLINIGFEARAGDYEYYPYFSVHNLCVEEDSLYGMLLNPLRYKNGAQDRVTIWAHNKGTYGEAVERMKQQAYIPIDGPVSLSQILEGYRRCYPHARPNVSAMSDPALIAAWCGDKERAESELLMIYTLYKGSSNVGNGMTSEEWYEDMLTRIQDPEGLHQITQEQIVYHKLDYIPQETLIPE